MLYRGKRDPNGEDAPAAPVDRPPRRRLPGARGLEHGSLSHGDDDDDDRLELEHIDIRSNDDDGDDIDRNLWIFVDRRERRDRGVQLHRLQ